jgi:hypothetical protein
MPFKNPICPKCKASMYSMYIRKKVNGKDTYSTLLWNYYCRNCKVVYEFTAHPIEKKIYEDESTTIDDKS